MDSQAGQEKRIQILFAEYRALRAEVIQRGSWLIQICTVAGTVTIAIVGFGFAYKAPFTGLILFFADANSVRIWLIRVGANNLRL